MYSGMHSLEATPWPSIWAESPRRVPEDQYPEVFEMRRVLLLCCMGLTISIVAPVL